MADYSKEKKGVNEPIVLNIQNSALATSPAIAGGDAVGSQVVESSPAKSQIPGQKSESSLRSDEGGVQGREIQDTLMGRLLYLKWSILAIIIELLFIYFLSLLHSDAGVTFNLGGDVFQQTVPVVLELWMLLCYLCTDLALGLGLSAYFGSKLSQKQGYSLIVCGFIQGGLFSKIQFSSLLNFRSKYKKIVSRASIVWFLHICMLILTFFCSTAITISTTRYDSGSLLCIEYGQVGSPVDRGWPTLDTQAGVAEFVFGTSLGGLTSEDGTLSYTTLVTYPQLIDAAADGTFIKGSGFTTTFASTCMCSPSNSITDMVYAGIPSENVTAMKTSLSKLGSGQGVAQMLSYNTSAPSITIYSILNGYRTCGGNNYVNQSVLVCNTVVDSHSATSGVSISWMNDGDNSRSAPNIALVDETIEPTAANMTWLYIAIQNAMGGSMSTIKMPGFYPGTVSPLVWWATPNLQTVSVSLVGPGLETFIAMLIKVGISRTYSVSGAQCTQNLQDTTKTTLNISKSGYQIGLAFVIIELFLAVASILLCVPWFIYKDPIIPAIRLVSDRTYFNIMLCKNSTGTLLRMLGSTSDRNDVWPKLDMEVRVGENIQTVADSQQGEIIVDKPKLVTQLSWTKYY